MPSQVGVLKRPEECKMRSRNGDKLSMHYTVRMGFSLPLEDMLRGENIHLLTSSWLGAHSARVLSRIVAPAVAGVALNLEHDVSLVSLSGRLPAVLPAYLIL